MKKAFTLVEMSIVLVILGLLVGGIMTGRGLLRASEVRSVSADFGRFLTAHTIFRDKYAAVPGDMPNATSYWNAIDAVVGTCIVTASTGGKTCNGNGDGKIWSSTGANYDEVYHYWVQLSSAGLIEGTYTGIATPSGRAHTPGVNSPRSKVGNAGFAAWNGSGVTPAPMLGKNLIIFGGATASDLPLAGAINGTEAWNVDTKIDDGKPSYGRVMVNAGTTYCMSSATQYVLNNEIRDCTLSHVTSF